jgi:hypothetical protein
MITRKDFLIFADYVGKSAGYCEPFTEKQIEHLANYLHAVNPRFDREKWIQRVNVYQKALTPKLT